MFSYFKNLVVGSELSQLETQHAKDRKGSKLISYDLADINFDQLRRKRAYYKGVNIQLGEEMDKGQLVGFSDLPDLLPIKTPGKWDGLNYNELAATTLTDEERQQASAEGTPGPNQHLFDYDT